MSNNSIKGYVTTLQNFLKFYNITVSLNFIGKIPHPIPKKVNYIYDWKIVEIQQFIDAASTYKKKAIMCLFQSGIGINELTELNHGDLQDEFEKGIILLHLKLTRRKKSIPFRTFFGRDEVKYLRCILLQGSN